MRNLTTEENSEGEINKFDFESSMSNQKSKISNLKFGKLVDKFWCRWFTDLYVQLQQS
ncbi:hypothetical protein NIES73_10980 [Sphaerospermopsis kisseleviana NIES-73]|jgi:hypothetical protein|nr:hypothetical protein NIES73_10980 [Sphaerospermopsis kisseleviana NIES-73]